MAAAEYLRCVTVVGNDTDLIVLLLHNTKDMELNSEHSTAVLPHQEAEMGLINCLISYVTPILYRIYLH